MTRFNASDFKARCLAILDEVERTGAVITIFKHGRPVAELRPVTKVEARFPQQALKNTVDIKGDVIASVLSPDEIDLERKTV